jgi:putative membrane protein insertion efficiency factor
VIGGVTQRLKSAAIWFVLSLLKLYQILVSPLLGPRCRFHPSCSVYASGCIRKHGLWRGCLLAARRILRCHPFHPGGVDPVP